jgi:hypothetical protein
LFVISQVTLVSSTVLDVDFRTSLPALDRPGSRLGGLAVGVLDAVYRLLHNAGANNRHHHGGARQIGTIADLIENARQHVSAKQRGVPLHNGPYRIVGRFSVEWIYDSHGVSPLWS